MFGEGSTISMNKCCPSLSDYKDDSLIINSGLQSRITLRWVPCALSMVMLQWGLCSFRSYIDSLETEIMTISLSGDGRVFCLVRLALKHVVVPHTGKFIQVSEIIENTEAQSVMSRSMVLHSFWLSLS